MMKYYKDKIEEEVAASITPLSKVKVGTSQVDKFASSTKRKVHEPSETSSSRQSKRLKPPSTQETAEPEPL